MFSDLTFAPEIPVRRWTALASFTLQATLVAAALTYPLLHIDSLPPVLHPLALPVASYAPEVQSQTTPAHGIPSAIQPIVVNTHRITFGKPSVQPENPGPAIAPSLLDIGAQSPDGVVHSIVSDFARPVPIPPRQERHIRQSVVMEGNLIHRVEPQYPAIAKGLHIAGAVVLKAIISRDGAITNLKVESGQSLLAQAALQAVRQWHYRPYYLNNQPIEVETEITVNFVLQQ
jgi:periplasmic protein TonB